MSIEYVMTVTSAESHAAVIADMRKKYPASPNCEPTVSGQFVHDEMVWLADRLEAAHERELAERGDAAKLREALTDAEKTLYDSSRSMYGIPPHLHALLARIRAALAAPPRNCDIMDASAIKVIFAERIDVELKCFPDFARELAKNIMVAVVDTLYAPNAPAEEGGAECAPTREVRNA